MRPADLRKLAAQRGDNVPGLVQAQGCLRQVRNPVRIRNGKRFHLLRRSHHLRHHWGFSQRPDNFVMVAMADKNQRITFLRKLHRFHVDLGHQGTGSVDHSQVAMAAGFAHFGRYAMCAVDHTLARRNFLNAVHEDRALFLQLLDYEAVMDDFLADINRRAECLQRDANDVDRPHHPRAEASRLQ